MLSKTDIEFFRTALSGYVTLQIEENVVNAFQLTQEIEKIFGEHVSPKVVEKLKAANGEFTSEIIKTAVLFLDIRNFTGFSENKSPEDVVQFLNTLFSFMLIKVIENEVIVNKYLGDRCIAVFGAPVDIGNPSEKALKAAKEICEQLNKQYDSSILFSEDVWFDLEHKEGSGLGEISVKGRTQPVKIYKL